MQFVEHENKILWELFNDKCFRVRFYFRKFPHKLVNLIMNRYCTLALSNYDRLVVTDGRKSNDVTYGLNDTDTAFGYTLKQLGRTVTNLHLEKIGGTQFHLDVMWDPGRVRMDKTLFAISLNLFDGFITDINY